MLLSIIIPLWVLDQWTKSLIIQHLKGKGRIKKGPLVFSYVENKGAAMGLLKKHPFMLKWMNTFVLFLLFLMYFVYETQHVFLYHLAMVFILSGGLGNVTDRFKRNYVVDFVSVNLKKVPYFNIADFYVLIGAVLLMVSQ